MARSILIDKITQYMRTNKLSQAQMASILGVSQAHVSRLLTGKQDPSEHILQNISSLVGDIFDQKRRNTKSVDSKSFQYENGFSISRIATNESGYSGDLCLIDRLSKTLFSFILADTVGHGKEAHPMSFAIKTSYYTALSIFNSSVLTPALIENSISTAVARTKSEWLGPPSVTTGIINFNLGTIECINSGNPPILFYRHRSKKLEVIDHKPIRASLSVSANLKNIDEPLILRMEPGDSVLLYTDGFQEAIPENLMDRFANRSKMFGGDSEAIISGLVKNEDQLKSALDDATAIAISKGR